jgi:hypothetical protein
MDHQAASSQASKGTLIDEAKKSKHEAGWQWGKPEGQQKVENRHARPESATPALVCVIPERSAPPAPRMDSQDPGKMGKSLCE